MKKKPSSALAFSKHECRHINSQSVGKKIWYSMASAALCISVHV